MTEWFRIHGRSFPWSETRDPYKIWISEIMLQQTVASAAVDHFTNWIRRWPDLTSLAAAGEDEVLRAWEGLGYYSRARNLRRAAQILAETGQTNLPMDYASLQALPGMGDYTASAVLSFAWDQPYLTLDANLKRVFQRLVAQVTWTKDLEKTVRSLAEQLFRDFHSREFNLGLMHLGQTLCRPSSPLCGDCPLSAGCQARIQSLQDRIPERKRREVTTLASRVLLARKGESFFLVRTDRGRMKGLWTFPRYPLSLSWEGEGQVLGTFVHTYTKYREELRPEIRDWEGENPPVPPGFEGRWMIPADIEAAALPSVYRKIWSQVKSLKNELF